MTIMTIWGTLMQASATMYTQLQLTPPLTITTTILLPVNTIQFFNITDSREIHPRAATPIISLIRFMQNSNYNISNQQPLTINTLLLLRQNSKQYVMKSSKVNRKNKLMKFMRKHHKK